jgi:hypothetical protein
VCPSNKYERVRMSQTTGVTKEEEDGAREDDIGKDGEGNLDYAEVEEHLDEEEEEEENGEEAVVKDKNEHDTEEQDDDGLNRA